MAGVNFHFIFIMPKKKSFVKESDIVISSDSTIHKQACTRFTGNYCNFLDFKFQDFSDFRDFK